MKAVTVVGARPQFVKAAVLRNLSEKYGMHEVLVHTGQHYDHAMSDIFFTELGMMPAQYKLDLEHRSHGGMTGEIMAATEEILIKEKPDVCIVYGDTNSTLAAALAASKLHVPVCHIEAGLRSFNKRMPEEINRILTDHVSDLLFCSTKVSVSNLANEGITENVYNVGDIMYDAVKMFSRSISKEKFYEQYGLDSAYPIALVTLHRAENVSDSKRFQRIIDYIRDASKNHQLIFPIHPNTRKKCIEYGISLNGFTLIDPLSYLDTQSILANSALVFTDSGGLQKEAYFHDVRCVTMRDETEWVETIDSGWNRLWINQEYACEPKEINEYGDGHCAERILQKIVDRYS